MHSIDEIIALIKQESFTQGGNCKADCVVLSGDFNIDRYGVNDKFRNACIK